ncbi:MAG: RNA polymerase sigma factor [Bacteroidia bacterium]
MAHLYTNNLHDREDLYQEIVFQLWKSFDSFNEQSKLSTWMYRVAMNTAIYTLKTAKRKINTISIDLETEYIVGIKDNSEELRVKVLYERIQMLNLLEKGIVMLYLEGKSHQEISEIVGISTSNVGTKISRIKEKLKKNNTYGTG